MRMLLKLLKVLNSETEPGQLGLGLCFGMVAGLTPLLSLHNLIVLLCVLLLRVNLSAFLLSLGFFSGIAWAIDPLMSRIGLAALQAGQLQGLWSALYNITLFRLEHFNNSIVMGSLIISAALFVPMLLLANALIRSYREHVLAWINKLRIMQALKASRIYSIYQSLSGWEVRP